VKIHFSLTPGLSPVLMKDINMIKPFQRLFSSIPANLQQLILLVGVSRQDANGF